MSKQNNKLLIDADEAAAELCSRSFYFFVQEFWDVIIPEVPVWNWHIEYLCNLLEEVVRRVSRREIKVEDIIINVPPGTSKSTIVTIMLPAWAWVIDPTLRVLTTSYSAPLAMKHAVKSREIIQSARFNRYFPYIELKKDQNNKTDYENTHGGQRYAAGLGGSITGQHFHIILVDDPLNPKEAASQVECENASELIDSTLNTRKVDKEITVTMLIMQRLAESDPTGHLLRKLGKKIKHICLPAESIDDVKPASLKKYYVNGLLDPIRLNRATLEEAMIDLGAARYAGQYAQRPAPAGGLIWKLSYFKVVPDDKFPEKKHLQQYGTDWDTAYTSNEENAATAYVSAGKIGNDIFIDRVGFGWWEMPAMIAAMKGQAAPHYIEAKASGKSAKSILHQDGIVAIEVAVPGGSDKVARANMATPVGEAGFVYVRASQADMLFNDPRQGILSFPKGQYADLADAIAQCLLRLGKKGGIGASSGRNREEE